MRVVLVEGKRDEALQGYRCDVCGQKQQVPSREEWPEPRPVAYDPLTRRRQLEPLGWGSFLFPYPADLAVRVEEQHLCPSCAADVARHLQYLRTYGVTPRPKVGGSR
jgi:hypothetical protein